MKDGTIWKWVLKPESVQKIEIPDGTNLISAGYTPWNEEVCVWGEVPNQKAEKITRFIVIVGTGHDLPSTNRKKFLGTVVIPNLGLVWHVYDFGSFYDTPIHIDGTVVA